MLRLLSITAFSFLLQVGSEDIEGLTIKVTKAPPEGCKMKSKQDDFVEMHYTTSVDQSSSAGEPGMQIDTSRDEDGMNDPMSFQIGSGRVIDGWDRGVHDMCEGEKRSLIIAPALAYGDQAYEDTNADKEKIYVPPGATIKVDVEMVKVIKLQVVSKHRPAICHKKIERGNTVKVHYTLWIHKTSISGTKGEELESSRTDPNGALEFVVGVGRVILGWDQGMIGLCEGEKVEMVVPPEFGYQEKGQGEKVPPLATLGYEVEVLEIQETNMFSQMDSNKDGKISFDELAFFMKSTQNLNDKTVIQQIMDGEDKNKDGFIDWDEAPFPKGSRPKTLPSFVADKKLQDEKEAAKKQEEL